jgi:hypothetical protein
MTGEPAGGPVRVDATELDWVEVTDEGRRLCLRLRDPAGHAVAVSLPLDSVNAVLTAVPRPPSDLLAGSAGQVYALDSWSLAHDQQGVVLTLHLADGAKIAFAMKSWQLAAIASLAGQATAPERTRLH